MKTKLIFTVIAIIALCIIFPIIKWIVLGVVITTVVLGFTAWNKFIKRLL